MTSVENALRSRYSCRQYLKKAVPQETIEAILETAQLTPSWCNTQPWQVILLSGSETDLLREKLHQHASSSAKANPDFAFPPRYEGIYRDRRKVCGVQLYQALGIGKEDRMESVMQALENFRFFGAPHLLLITTSEDLGVYGAVDCGLYVSNFILRHASEVSTRLLRRRWPVTRIFSARTSDCLRSANSCVASHLAMETMNTRSTAIAPSARVWLTSLTGGADSESVHLEASMRSCSGHRLLTAARIISARRLAPGRSASGSANIR